METNINWRSRMMMTTNNHLIKVIISGLLRNTELFC
jgi:hypothetical protein